MTATVSSLSLLSLVKHSAIWERRWFQVIVAGRRFADEWPEVKSAGVDLTFRLNEADTVETVVADYREQIAASQQILSNFDLDAPCAWPDMADQNLRWVALHMIEDRSARRSRRHHPRDHRWHSRALTISTQPRHSGWRPTPS